MRRREQGYSMALWAVILTVTVLPTLALTIDVPMMMRVRSDLQEAADAAAEAAALEVDIPHFRDTGGVRLAPGAAGAAQTIFYQTFTAQSGGHAQPAITAITIDEGQDLVIVEAAATWRPFILGMFSANPTIHTQGWARYRVITH